MQRYSDPPLIPTRLRPRDIIGDNMEEFTAHCRKWWGKNEHNHKVSAMAARIISDLAKQGYSVTGLDAYGNLTFSVTLKLKVDQLFDSGMKELAGLSMEELRGRARGGYRKIATSISDGDWQNPGKIDMERERYAF
jgi:hypothetical protein